MNGKQTGNLEEKIFQKDIGYEKKVMWTDIGSIVIGTQKKRSQS
jgi:hypothetical protein